MPRTKREPVYQVVEATCVVRFQADTRLSTAGLAQEIAQDLDRLLDADSGSMVQCCNSTVLHVREEADIMGTAENPGPANTPDPIDAMCAWEHVIERIRHEPLGKWARYANAKGFCALRSLTADISRYLTTAWLLAQDAGFSGSFDWDFTPRFLEDATGMACGLALDWRDIARRLGREG